MLQKLKFDIVDVSAQVKLLTLLASSETSAPIFEFSFKTKIKALQNKSLTKNVTLTGIFRSFEVHHTDLISGLWLSWWQIDWHPRQKTCPPSTASPTDEGLVMHLKSLGRPGSHDCFWCEDWTQTFSSVIVSLINPELIQNMLEIVSLITGSDSGWNSWTWWIPLMPSS